MDNSYKNNQSAPLVRAPPRGVHNVFKFSTVFLQHAAQEKQSSSRKEKKGELDFEIVI
jgi:hypothetical protein